MVSAFKRYKLANCVCAPTDRGNISAFHSRTRIAAAVSFGSSRTASTHIATSATGVPPESRCRSVSRPLLAHPGEIDLANSTVVFRLQAFHRDSVRLSHPIVERAVGVTDCEAPTVE